MRTNDFGITFSTINGSGSATANNTLLRAIYKMGIPVSARNIFPSNIQGMPTWYNLRVNADGYLGRKERSEILIAMNPETVQTDIQNMEAAGLILYNDELTIGQIPQKMQKIAMPIKSILENCGTPPNLNIYLANMVYVGILAFLIGIRLDKIEAALDYHFDHRQSAIAPNLKVVQSAYQWAQDNVKIDNPFRLKEQEFGEGRIMVDGNTAAALGALFGGLQYSAWYPITPATGLAEALNEYIPQLRMDPQSGSTTCVVVQAEDELAAIGMVVGAGWAGLRSMTSTSGPGLCLMAEYLGLAYFAEVPIVVWDVQRVGPSTGLPTHTSQGDLTFTYFISHGDKDMVILLPANVNECFEFGWKALDIAEQLQTPVIVLSDLELGMNIWGAEPFAYPDQKIERGKVLWEKDLENWAKKGREEWGRYKDVDGDGIPYRTIPGNLHEKAPYFTRGTGHDVFAHYSEDNKDWEDNLLRLKRKIENAKKLIPLPEISSQESGKIGFISYGSSHLGTIEATHLLRAKNQPVDYLRIRALPFTEKIEQFLEDHERVYVTEANRDGQMKNLLCMHYPKYAERLESIAKCDGLSLSAEWIVEQFDRLIESEK